MSRRTNGSSAARNQPDLFSFAAEPVVPKRSLRSAPPRRSTPQPVPSKPPCPATRANKDNAPPQAITVRPVHLLDVSAAAAWLGLSKSTLDKMRCYGTGPRFIRASGKAVRYDPADLAAFAEGRRQHRTSDPTPT